MDHFFTASYNRIGLALFASLLVIPGAWAQEDFFDLSLEQLLSVEVTSASRKAQSLSDVAAAIFVISAEDLRRSGVTSIPEALRMVPGVHVGRIDDNRWAVSARGFNDQYSNKLLVLMDGRHIYTPHYAGVFWDHHSLSIDNIERIEVIRGPGATLWGSNAVNGVINIISRSARDTRGMFLQARAGDRDSHNVAARYGDASAGGWFYRVDFNLIEEDFTDSVLNTDGVDYWQQQKTSFRLEGTPITGHELTFDGALFNGNSRDLVNTLDSSGPRSQIAVVGDDIDTYGGWLTIDWASQRPSGEGWQVKAYYDHNVRDSYFAESSQKTLSLDFQSRHLLGRRHDLIWGFAYRDLNMPFESRSSLFGDLILREDFQLAELFVQDEISLANNLALTIGAKLEDTEYIDSLQVQPNIRLNWRANDRLSLWASLSNAARTPSLGERLNFITPNLFVADLPVAGLDPVPIGIGVIGNQDMESEWLTAAELGVRGRLSESLDFDLSLFQFQYDDLRNSVPQGLNCQPGDVALLANPACLPTSTHVTALIGIVNEVEATTTGAELALQWQPSDHWQIIGALSWFDYDLQDIQTINQLSSYDEPGWLAHVRSHWAIGDNMSLDLTLRGVDESAIYELDSYTTADIRFEWKPTTEWTFELIGQNLLDNGHREYGAVTFETLPAEIMRSLMARITWAP